MVALSVGRIRSNASRKVPLYCQLLRNYDLWINKRTIRTVRENQQHQAIQRYQTWKSNHHARERPEPGTNLKQIWRSGADVLPRRGSRFPIQITWLPQTDSRAPSARRHRSSPSALAVQLPPEEASSEKAGGVGAGLNE